jgi:hypothetical protein
MRNVLVSMIFFSFGLLSSNVQSAVWEDSEKWSLDYEKKFSEWIVSDEVHEYMFISPASKYFGMYSDCADVSYALRAIFAYENKLPFAVTNPSGSRKNINTTLNNRLTTWDHHPEGIPRLVAMVNDITTSVGTDNLAYMDTYPAALKTLTPGSVFISRLKLDTNYSVKHAYNIKNINPVGTFDVIYSSESIQADKKPLLRRKDKEMDILPSDPFGYRKFRWPEQLGLKVKEMPVEMQASNEQFEQAKKLGIQDFNKLLRKKIGTVDENDSQKLLRSLQTVCQEAQIRIAVVNSAQDYLLKINNQCMDFREFDIYSTPARDASIKEAFFSLQRNFFEIKDNDGLEAVEPQIVEFAEEILLDSAPTNDSLLKWCPIEYKTGTSIDLAELWKRTYYSKLSSHPNDSVESRWGEAAALTSCKRWY